MHSLVTRLSIIGMALTLSFSAASFTRAEETVASHTVVLREGRLLPLYASENPFVLRGKTWTRLEGGTRVVAVERARPVRQTFVRQTRELIDLTTIVDGRTDTLQTTPEHPVHSGSGFVPAAMLERGAAITFAGQSGGHVHSVTRHETLSTVYNFEVEDTHNYFAGEIPVLVHNADYPNLKRAAAMAKLHPGEPMTGVVGLNGTKGKLDLVITHNGDELLQHVDNIYKQPSEFTIFVHGHERAGFALTVPGGWTRVPAEVIANAAHAQGLRPGQCIRLASCYSADNGSAQALANLTRSPVIESRGVVTVSDGLQVEDIFFSSEGWRLFRPEP